MTVTSNAARTSPVTRGKWFLQTFLGVSPPDPPPDVPALRGADRRTPPATRSRRRCGRRSSCTASSPTCASCHQIFEPMGLALENFDAVGAGGRSTRASRSTPRAILPDGTKVDGVVDLRGVARALLAQFVQVVAEKLLTYALGRGTEHEDMPMVRRSCATRRPSGYKFSALVLSIVKSDMFRMNQKAAAETATRTGVQVGRETLHVSDQEARFAADDPAWRGRHAVAAAARRDGAGGDGAGADGGQPRSRGSSACSCRTARRPATGCPRRRARSPAELPFNWKPLEPFVKQTVILSGLHSRSAEPPPGVTGADHWVAAAFMCAVKPRKTAGADVYCRHDHRPADRAADRAREPDAVDAAGGGGSGRQLEQLRRGLQLHLHEHHLVGVAHVAAADGAQPAGGVRADVRRRQHRRAAHGAPQARPEHPRLADAARSPACAATSARPTARASTTTPRTCARSSAGLQIAMKASTVAPENIEVPVGVPQTFDEHIKLQFDLLALAFQADITRVGTLLFARDLTGRTYPRARRRRPASTACRTTAKTRGASPSCRRSTSTT